MTSHSLSRPSLLLALTSLFALSGYNCNDVLDDPGFDLWCDDQLCSWQLESGSVARVPTWHESDFGVELVGPDVAISQPAARNDFSCLRFELIADIEETAEVTLELDFSIDGEVEHAQRIPTSDWQQLSYQVRMPETFDSLLFRIRKRGHGRAVLAEIAALSEGDCSGLDPVALSHGAARPHSGPGIARSGRP